MVEPNAQAVVLLDVLSFKIQRPIQRDCQWAGERVYFALQFVRRLAVCLDARLVQEGERTIVKTDVAMVAAGADSAPDIRPGSYCS